MGPPFACHDGTDELVISGQPQKLEDWVADAQKALEGKLPPGDVTAVAESLRFISSTRRVAFIPVCEPASGNGLGLLDNKVGGLPYLLASESWPTNGDSPLCHLWQQRVSDLPTAVQRALGRSAGLMQVFVAQMLDDEGGDWYVVRVLEEEQLVSRPSAEVVPPPEVRVLDELRVVSYTPVYDFPLLDDLLNDLPEGLDRNLVEDLVDGLEDAGLYETVTGDKLLGWPNWCQGPEWCVTDDQRRYTHIVQIEGNEVDFIVGDSGTLLLQRHPDNRDCWGASWACS